MEGIDPKTPLRELPAKKLRILMNGSSKEYKAPEGFSFLWPGVNVSLALAGRCGRSQLRNALLPLLDEIECPSCKGMRLNPLARHVTIEGTSIGELCQMPIEKALAFLEALKIPESDAKVLEEVYKQLLSRLRFLSEVGLHYIALERKAPTLSGGETQRIRLAKQLGTSLTGVLYVLDEPTIGLPERYKPPT